VVGANACLICRLTAAFDICKQLLETGVARRPVISDPMYCPRATTRLHSSRPNFFDLYTNQRTQPHPPNLRAGSGEAPQTVGIVAEVKGNDIRPVIEGTCESAINEPREYLANQQVKRRGDDACEPMGGSGIEHGNSVYNRPRSGRGLRKKQCEGSAPRTLFFWTCRCECRRNPDRWRTY
jgi:hypothetical protein